MNPAILTGFLYFYDMHCPFRFIFLLVFLFSLVLPDANCQSSEIDSLKKVLLKAKDTNRVNTLNDIAWVINSSNPDSSVLLSSQALKFAKKINWKKGIANSNGQLGVFHFWQANYQVALSYHLAALKIKEELNDKIGIAKSLGNIGAIYESLANYPKALEYNFKALKMREKLGDKNGVARHLGNIGVTYLSLTNYTKALEYFFKALKIAEEFGDELLQANTLGSIGLVYNEQADFPKALGYYFKALKINQKLGNNFGIAVILSNIGSVYFAQALACSEADLKKELFSKAEDYFFQTLKINREIEDNRGMAMTLAIIGSLNIKMGNTYPNQSTHHYNKAEEYLKKALSMSREMGALSMVRIQEKHFSDLDSARGNFKGSFEHYKNYIAARDSITNEENTKKQTQQEMQYEFDQKVAIAKAKQEKKDAVTRIVIYSISGGLCLVLVLAGFIFRGYRQKRKVNQIITQQKQEVERQKLLVEQKQKEVIDSIHYAKRIQQALLPSEKYIGKHWRKLN